jgi:predicted dehydrogenase
MTLRVGLIGCGGIMRVHVQGWAAQSQRAEIVAVADISEDNVRTRVKEIGRDVKVYSDYRDLLADDSIDAVDIGLPHHLHCESITAAARAGKHLMTEKPLCLSLEEAEEIRSAVEGSGIIMMAAHNQLFYPAVLQAKQMILHGDLGEIYAIHSLDCDARRGRLDLNKNNWGKNKRASLGGWRTDIAKMGGGELIDTGYHPTYRMLFLAGQTPTEVTAMLGTYRMDMDREDTAHVLMKFANGMTGQIMSSWAIRAPGAQNALFYIMAEAGQLWGMPDRLHYQPVNFTSPATVEYPGWTGAHTFHAEIAHFVDAIEGGYQPMHSVTEATDTLRVILAAYESVETGQTARL